MKIMKKTAKQFRDKLIEKILNFPDDLEPQYIDCGDYINVRPQRKEKKFSKTELIHLIKNI